MQKRQIKARAEEKTAVGLRLKCTSAAVRPSAGAHFFLVAARGLLSPSPRTYSLSLSVSWCSKPTVWRLMLLGGAVLIVYLQL
jgi:hypothetical protein